MFDPKIQQIVPGPHDALSISIEIDEDRDNPTTYPMLLFVPNQKKPAHYHIAMNRMQAVALRNWLNEYLGD